MKEEPQKVDENSVLCEKCGEPTSTIFALDESYDYCKDCNHITHV
jgi:formylmethanofuran dehydrogenase subunit E